MTETIEIRGFMQLSALFSERGWSNPYRLEVENTIPGPALLEKLSIPRKDIECLIVNRRTVTVDSAVVNPGDRVALVPPGVPGPHRVLLGIREAGAAPVAPKNR